MPTPRERILAVLAGEKPDRVPFIIWDNKIPSPEVERRFIFGIIEDVPDRGLQKLIPKTKEMAAWKL